MYRTAHRHMLREPSTTWPAAGFASVHAVWHRRSPGGHRTIAPAGGTLGSGLIWRPDPSAAFQGIGFTVPTQTRAACTARPRFLSGPTVVPLAVGRAHPGMLPPLRMERIRAAIARLVKRAAVVRASGIN